MKAVAAVPLSVHRLAYVREQRRRGLSERTIGESRRVLDTIERWRGGDVLDVTRREIESWLDSCAIASRSTNSYVSVTRAFFRWAVAEELRGDDPTAAIRAAKTPRRFPRPMADEDLARAIASVSPVMGAWLALAAFQGFRCKEIALLRRQDIFERSNPPVIRVANGKGGHEAILPLNAETFVALERAGLPSAGPVFVAPQRGAAYSPRTVSRRIAEYLRTLGIDATAHCARHWYGTAVWSESKDLRLTQEMLRHVNPQTTAIYAAYDREAAGEVVGRLHERLGQPVEVGG